MKPNGAKLNLHVLRLEFSYTADPYFGDMILLHSHKIESSPNQEKAHG